MITYTKIIQDLEEIYQLLIADGNLTLALKAKELQGRQLEMIQKGESKSDPKTTRPLKDMELEKLIALAQKYTKKV